MRRTTSRLLIPTVCFVLAGCLGPRETPLEGFPDVVDRPSGMTENAPLKTHPRGLELDVLASVVATTVDDREERSFHVTLHIENLSEREVVLPVESWRMRDDDGRAYRPRGALVWNEEKEDYDPAPPAFAPGAKELLVVQFPIGRRVNLKHLLRVTLHWRYEHAGREHRVATRFRVR